VVSAEVLLWRPIKGWPCGGWVAPHLALAQSAEYAKPMSHFEAELVMRLHPEWHCEIRPVPPTDEPERASEEVRRCSSCGYLVTDREHQGCLRAADTPALTERERRVAAEAVRAVQAAWHAHDPSTGAIYSLTFDSLLGDQINALDGGEDER